MMNKTLLLTLTGLGAWLLVSVELQAQQEDTTGSIGGIGGTGAQEESDITGGIGGTGVRDMERPEILERPELLEGVNERPDLPGGANEVIDIEIPSASDGVPE